MKKINYLYLLLLTVVTTLWGCSDFEDLNKDDTKLPELGMSHVGAAFAYSQYWGMYADRYEFELVSSVMSNLYVQYFTNVTRLSSRIDLPLPINFQEEHGLHTI